MPQEPKKRHSKADKRTRRAAIKLDAAVFITCKNCQAKTLPNMTCRNCGFYKGKIVGKAPVKVTTA